MSTDPVEAEALFDARRLAYPALEQRGDAVLTEDVCLPRGRLAEMLARVEEIGTRHDVLIANIAHAGDGNLHPLLITPHGDDAAAAAGAGGVRGDRDTAIDLGGTVTGEHGVGPAQAGGHAARARAGRARDAAGGQGGPRPARHPQPRQGGRVSDDARRCPRRSRPVRQTGSRCPLRPSAAGPRWLPDGALTYPELAARAGALAREIAGLDRVAV